VFRHGFWGTAKCPVLILLLGIALTSRWEGLEHNNWFQRDLHAERSNEAAL